MIYESWPRSLTENLSHHRNKLSDRLPHVGLKRETMSSNTISLGGSSDSLPAIAAKAGPSVGVSLATIAGYSVSDIILWATLIYTVLMIAHKLYHIWRDLFGKKKDRHEE